MNLKGLYLILNNFIPHYIVMYEKRGAFYINGHPTDFMFFGYSIYEDVFINDLILRLADKDLLLKVT